MVEIKTYISSLTSALQEEFGPRLRYVGLQGSYLREEATEDSDIDVMVLLDGFSVADMDEYRRLLMDLGHYERSCGFICDVEEFRRWNKLELCHVLHTTKDCFGRLSDFISDYSQEDVRQFAKLSLNNLYHAICHSYIHRGPERTYKMLPGLFKGTFFILQDLAYLKTGEFAATKRELLQKLDGTDKMVLEYAMGRSGMPEKEALELLFSWCGDRIRNM